MNYLKLYKTIMILSSFTVISSLALPSFCFAQTTAEIPSTFGEAKDFIIRLVKPLPEKIKDIWQNEVLPKWQKMGEKVSKWFNKAVNWFSDIWYETIKPWISNLLDKIKSFINEKITERKPAIEQEFEKEKQEMKQVIPEVSKGLWQRFKELIR